MRKIVLDKPALQGCKEGLQLAKTLICDWQNDRKEIYTSGIQTYHATFSGMCEREYSSVPWNSLLKLFQYINNDNFYWQHLRKYSLLIVIPYRSENILCILYLNLINLFIAHSMLWHYKVPTFWQSFRSLHNVEFNKVCWSCCLSFVF